MEISFKIWCRAMFIYTVCMLPTVIVPVIFLYAVGLALMWGIPALILFAPSVAGAKKMNLFDKGTGFLATSITGMTLCFAATYGACWLMAENSQRAMEAMSENIIYPLVAWLSAAISLITYSRSIGHYFTQKTLEHAI